LCGASLHGISLFTHEGVHGVLHPNKAINHLLAAVCAWPVLQNFAAYRVLHLDHHKNLGAQGDPDHYENYAARRRMIYAMHWGRLLLGYPAYILAIPFLGFQQGSRRDRFLIVLELLALAAGLSAVLLSPIPRDLLIHGWLLPMVMINTMVNIRGMSQHTLLEQASDVIKGTRSILTNPVTTFFMCNENYHLEHHLYPGVPWYHLPRLHKEIRSSLEAQGAPLVPSYWAFVREFVVSTLIWEPVGTVTPMRSELASR
jgi:fatty acid desaturase